MPGAASRRHDPYRSRRRLSSVAITVILVLPVSPPSNCLIVVFCFLLLSSLQSSSVVPCLVPLCRIYPALPFAVVLIVIVIIVTCLLSVVCRRQSFDCCFGGGWRSEDLYCRALRSPLLPPSPCSSPPSFPATAMMSPSPSSLSLSASILCHHLNLIVVFLGVGAALNISVGSVDGA